MTHACWLKIDIYPHIVPPKYKDVIKRNSLWVFHTISRDG